MLVIKYILWKRDPESCRATKWSSKGVSSRGGMMELSSLESGRMDGWESILEEFIQRQKVYCFMGNEHSFIIIIYICIDNCI